jgi:hypothetical protein
MKNYSKEIPSISKEIEYVVKEGSPPSEKVFSEFTKESIQIGKNNYSKMLRNTPISPVIKADAESDARFFFLRQYSFYSAVCSIENKKHA